MCQENGDKIINRVTVSGVIVSGVIVETETYHLGFVSVTFEGRIRNVRVNIFMFFKMCVKIFQ